jgi:uncharacterized protein
MSTCADGAAMTMHAQYGIPFCIFLAACCSVASAREAETAQILGPSGSSYAVPVTTMKGARFAATLHQQYDFSCGSAAVATLLTHHYGRKVDEVEVFRFMFERGDQAKIRREGFSMLDMKLYLDGLGFRAEGVQATLDQLASVGIPAIALIKENGYMHFIVIKGVRGRRVVIGDPALGTRVLDRAAFETYWTNGILLVINNAVTQARFNRDEDWRVRPAAPLADAAAGPRDADMMLLRRNPGDF